MSINFVRYRPIITLGFPILVGQLGGIVLAFADNIMVGHYSTPALASASFVNNVFNVAMFACMGFTYGLTPLAGALFTQKRYADIGRLMRSALLSNLLFALLIMAIMTAIWLNIGSLGQPAELLPLIRPYFLLILAGVIPVTLFSLFSQWLFAINDTSLPMWIVLGCNALNIVGNYALIYGHLGCPEMGLIGAGVSTLLSRILSMVLIMGIFFGSRRFRDYRCGFLQSRIDRSRLTKINRTSWPVALQMALESGSFSVAALMAGWLGAVSLASFQIIVITGTLGFCIYYSIGSAVSVLVANAAGVHDSDGMRRTAFAGYHVILTLAAISSAVFILLGRSIVMAFTDDPVVIEATLILLFPLILYQLGDATQINFAGALRGTANVMPMIWIAFISYVVVGIPATYILGFPLGLGTYGIVLSFSVSLFLAGALFLIYFLRFTRSRR